MDILEEFPRQGYTGAASGSGDFSQNYSKYSTTKSERKRIFDSNVINLIKDNKIIYNRINEYNNNQLLKREGVMNKMLNYVDMLLKMAQKVRFVTKSDILNKEPSKLMKLPDGENVYVFKCYDEVNEERIFAGKILIIGSAEVVEDWFNDKIILQWSVGGTGFEFLPRIKDLKRLQMINGKIMMVTKESVYPMNLIFQPQMKDFNYIISPMNLIQAAPGSGKTRSIIEEVKILQQYDTKYKVIVATQEQRKQYLQHNIKAQTIESYYDELLRIYLTEKSVMVDSNIIREYFNRAFDFSRKVVLNKDLKFIRDGENNFHSHKQFIKEVETHYSMKLNKEDFRNCVADLARKRTMDNKWFPEIIYFDEVYMYHSALIIGIDMILQYYNVRPSLILYGDAGQIPVISRTGLKFKYHRPDEMVSNITQRYNTYRCPQTIIPVLDTMYKDIKTKSKVKGSIEVKLINKIEEIDTPKDSVVLVFTQSEKEMLKRYCNTVMTVHESQGLTFEKVILVRLHYFEVTLYNDVHYQVVAFSRHTKSICYYTVKKDMVYNILEKVQYTPEDKWDTTKCMLVKYAAKICDRFYEHHLIVEKVSRRVESVQKEYYTRFLHDKRFSAITEKVREMKFKDINSNYKVVKLYDKWIWQPMYFILQPLGIMSVAAHRYRPEYHYERMTPQEMFKVEHNVGNYCYDTEERETQWFTILKLLIGETDMDTFKYMEEVEKVTQTLKSYSNVEINEMLLMEYTKKSVQQVENYEKDNVLVMKESIPLRGRMFQNVLMVMNSIIKRNLDPSKLRDDYSVPSHEAVLKCFEDKIINKEKKESTDYKTLGAMDDQFTKEWICSRTTRQLGKLQAEEHKLFDKTEWNKYECFLKTTIKLKMSEKEFTFGPTTQVVTGASTVSVYYFNQYVKIMEFRMKMLLKDKFVLNDCYSDQEIEAMINEGIAFNSPVKILELDYAKYDKNQDGYLMMLQARLFEYLGMPQELISAYIQSHQDCVLLFRKVGIKVKVNYQRRTGDAFTYFGNTLVNMLIAGYILKDEDIKFAVFGGDDSLIMLDGKSRFEDKSDYIARAFNMEVKYLNNETSIMYASKFLIQNENGNYVLIPDVMKMIARMFRDDIQNYEHLTAIEINYKLLLFRLYENKFLMTALVKQTKHRYNLKIAEDDLDYLLDVFVSSLFEVGMLWLFKINKQNEFYTSWTAKELDDKIRMVRKKLDQFKFDKDTLPWTKGERSMLDKIYGIQETAMTIDDAKEAYPGAKIIQRKGRNYINYGYGRDMDYFNPNDFVYVDGENFNLQKY